MIRSKPTRATRAIHEMADYAEQSGASIDWDSAMGTFCISAKGQDDIFMQDDEAETEILNIETMCKRYPSLDEYTAALSIAEGYIDRLWS